jgi:hypothetical protein
MEGHSMSQEQQPEQPPAPVESYIVKPVPALPQILRAIQLPVGKHRRAIKAGHFGGDKAGKSYMLASYPSPKVVVDGGNGGCALYIDPASGDVVFDASYPDEILAAVQHGLDNQDYFKSVVMDDSTNMYTNWHESWADKNLKEDEEIHAKHWRLIKGPWKAMWRKLDASKLHVGIGCRLKDILYTQDNSDGKQGKMDVRQVVMPEVEKSVPYVMDLLFYHEQLFDVQHKPKETHRVTFWRGRIPKALVKELRPGRKWDFADKDRENPWARIIEPMLVDWKMDGAELIGVDPTERQIALTDMAAAAADQDLGKVLRLIGQPHPNMATYAKLFETEVVPLTAGLTAEGRRIAQAAHEKRKTELSTPAGGKE